MSGAGWVRGGRPVEVKCLGVCDSGDVRRRKREGCAVREIEGDGREGRGRLKDPPMRGDLDAAVRFYECGFNATRVHAYTDTYRWRAKLARLIQATLIFPPQIIHSLLSEGGTGIIFWLL